MERTEEGTWCPTTTEFDIPETPGTVVAHAIRNRVLEDAIARDPMAIAPYVVYADWLQDRGDPRGELIAIQLSLHAGNRPDLRSREAAIWRTSWPLFVGPAAIHGVWRATLRLGFVRQFRVAADVDLDELDGAFAIDHIATRFLESLVVPATIAGVVRARLDRRRRGHVFLIVDRGG
jgi:uncharacterized protein (TIGR02996 family)